MTTAHPAHTPRTHYSTSASASLVLVQSRIFSAANSANRFCPIASRAAAKQPLIICQIMGRQQIGPSISWTMNKMPQITAAAAAGRTRTTFFQRPRIVA